MHPEPVSELSKLSVIAAMSAAVVRVSIGVRSAAAQEAYIELAAGDSQILRSKPVHERLCHRCVFW